MNEGKFARRFREWEASLDPAMSEYVKADIAAYDMLCSLYLAASPEQRQQLPSLVAQGNSHAGVIRLNYLIYYMRWVAERIRTPDDVDSLWLGLAAAAILEEGIDERDVIVSLAFLHNAATEAGIDPAPYYKDVADMARPEMRRFIRGFLERSSRDIKSMVDVFKYAE
jgi:hypothetical protein